MYAPRFTYDKFKKMSKFDYLINEDKLINISINTSYLGKMSDKIYNQWIDILDKKINQKTNKISNHINIDVNDNINNNKEDSFIKCGNYGHGCDKYVINRTYFHDCIDDGVFYNL